MTKKVTNPDGTTNLHGADGKWVGRFPGAGKATPPQPITLFPPEETTAITTPNPTSVLEVTDFYGENGWVFGREVEVKTPNGVTVHLDSKIAEVIQALWENGCPTIASCAGHLEDPEDPFDGEGYVAVPKNFAILAGEILVQTTNAPSRLLETIKENLSLDESECVYIPSDRNSGEKSTWYIDTFKETFCIRWDCSERPWLKTTIQKYAEIVQNPPWAHPKGK